MNFCKTYKNISFEIYIWNIKLIFLINRADVKTLLLKWKKSLSNISGKNGLDKIKFCLKLLKINFYLPNFCEFS